MTTARSVLNHRPSEHNMTFPPHDQNGRIARYSAIAPSVSVKAAEPHLAFGAGRPVRGDLLNHAARGTRA
jgi:hypothetical protein